MFHDDGLQTNHPAEKENLTTGSRLIGNLCGRLSKWLQAEQKF